MKIFSIMLIGSLLLSSCLGEVNCFKRSGPRKSEPRILPFFDRIVLEDNLDLNLIRSDSGLARVEAGKHLLENIQLEVQAGELHIRNANRCNWTRNLSDRAVVTLWIPADVAISHYGYGDIRSLENLKLNYLVISCLNGGGNLDIEVTCSGLNLYSNTQSDIYFRGKTDYLNLKLDGIGRIRAESLVSTQCEVQHAGSNEIRVYPLKFLKAQIEANGNLYYYHTPDSIRVQGRGSGRVLAR
jgi:hypothetical protein